MKRFIFAAALAFASLPGHTADIGVTINIGQPDFYGRIDVGGYSAPRLLYSQPRFLYRAASHRAPIYLNVPPGHARNWSKHCRHYNACGERVYFVQNDWYRSQYVPQYQQRHKHRGQDDHRRDVRGDDRDHHRADDHRSDGRHDNDKGKKHDRDDDRGGQRGNDRGRDRDD